MRIENLKSNFYRFVLRESSFGFGIYLNCIRKILVIGIIGLCLWLLDWVGFEFEKFLNLSIVNQCSFNTNANFWLLLNFITVLIVIAYTVTFFSTNIVFVKTSHIRSRE